MDLDGGGSSRDSGVRVVDGGGDESVEGGDGGEPPDGIDRLRLRKAVEDVAVLRHIFLCFCSVVAVLRRFRSEPRSDAFAHIIINHVPDAYWLADWSPHRYDINARILMYESDAARIARRNGRRSHGVVGCVRLQKRRLSNPNNQSRESVSCFPVRKAMRAVTGSVASSRPISLSKAAAVLDRFTAGQAGARPDVAAFVRRASAAFDELVIFHRANRPARKHPELYVSVNSREEVEKWKSRKRSRDDPRIGKKATNGVGVHGKDANFVEEDGNGFSSHGEKKKQHKGKCFMEERSSLPVKEGKLLHSDRNLVEQGRHHSNGVESQEDGKGRRKKMKPEVEEVILHRNLTQDSSAGAELLELELELEDQKDHHKKRRKKKARAEDVN